MNNPKLQLALDTTSMNEAIEIAEELHEWWDILEIGTVLLLKEGLRSVSKFRKIYPGAVILADTKIIDSGKLLAKAACEAGASIVSVVSAAAEKTIADCVEAAHANGCQVLLDHLSVDWKATDLVNKGALGVDLIGLHLPKDVQTNAKLDRDAIRKVARQTKSAISIAGGIDPIRFNSLREYPIDVYVVGGYLLKAENKSESARRLKIAISSK